MNYDEEDGGFASSSYRDDDEQASLISKSDRNSRSTSSNSNFSSTSSSSSSLSPNHSSSSSSSSLSPNSFRAGAGAGNDDAIDFHAKAYTTRTMTVSEHFALSSYWFGWSFLWLPLLVVIIPSQVMHLAGDADKGAAMGTSLFLGSFVSLFAAPLFGYMSDNSLSKYGRRRPFMVVGTVIASFALFGMAVSPTLSFFSFSFLCLSVANNMIMAPYSALVPDFVPIDQRGIASGWLGGMSMLGYLAGGVVSYHMESTGTTWSTIHDCLMS
jgi:hypothetical protein